MKNKRYLLEHLKGLQLNEIELIGKDWEEWLEGQSRETLRAYLVDVHTCATALGFSLEEAQEIHTPIALKNATLYTYALLAGWKGYELRAIRAAEPGLLATGESQ